MGRGGIIPANSNHNLTREAAERIFFSSIHRARVTDVHINKGTVDVDFEAHTYRREILFPLLGLSYPPSDPDEDNSKSSSWGRYIPQVGDMLLVGFSSAGVAFSFGYHAIYYEGFDISDENRQAKGGIGWGKASDRRLSPGDWDFKSSRGGVLYLGDRARVGSGSATTEWSKTDNSITTTTNLNRSRYGQASETRHGDVKRLILPTDTQESYIPSALNPLLNAQESLDAVKVGSVNPAFLLTGQELVRRSIGEVIDDDAVSPTLMMSDQGAYVRSYLGVKDPTGLFRVYEHKVDILGNYEVSSTTAIQFQWTTPLAAWDITNLSTSILSTFSFEVTAGTSIDFTAGESFGVASPITSIESAAVNLGTNANDFLIKGTKFMGYYQILLTALAADMQAIGSILGVGTSTATAANAMNAVLSDLTSQVSKTA